MKILLVDDSRTMRTIQKLALAKIGLEQVTEAENGKLALAMLAAEKFDLVLMDWNMPEMSGIEALKKIKADPMLKSIPVIMVTSESEKSRIVEALQAGATNYLVKPFQTEALCEKLKAFLKK